LFNTDAFDKNIFINNEESKYIEKELIIKEAEKLESDKVVF
jgi:hypothetical protein